MNATVSAIQRIGRDRVQGATALAEAALGAISGLAASMDRTTAAERRPALLQLSDALRLAQPGMGPFQEWARELALLAEDQSGRGPTPSVWSWVQWWTGQLEREREILPAATGISGPRLRHVVILSHSETVVASLSRLPKYRRPELVTVLRSSPGGEGATTARELSAAGYDVRLVSDVEGPEMVRSSELFLIGADAVLRDGSLIHKTGTRRLAAVAARARVRVRSATGTSKFVGVRYRELPPIPRRFDLTPARLVTEYATEVGNFHPAQVAEFDFDRAVRAAHRSGSAVTPRGPTRRAG